MALQQPAFASRIRGVWSCTGPEHTYMHTDEPSHMLRLKIIESESDLPTVHDYDVPVVTTQIHPGKSIRVSVLIRNSIP